MTTEPGQIFLLDPNGLPGARAHIIRRSPFAGWLVACFFGDEPQPGIVATAAIDAWFEMGRWTISHIDEVPDIPQPLAVVNRHGSEVLIDYEGRALREALPGELQLLGRPVVISPARLLNACKAYLGKIHATPDLEDLTFASLVTKTALVGDDHE